MLNMVIFLPLLTGLVVLMLPRTQPALVRHVALGGAVLTLVAVGGLWIGYNPMDPALQWRSTAPWIPTIGVRYEVAVDGLSLPLMALTALLVVLAMIYVLPQYDRAKEHAVLFLVMATGLLGLFSAQDLLLLYLFFEVGLVAHVSYHWHLGA